MLSLRKAVMGRNTLITTGESGLQQPSQVSQTPSSDAPTPPAWVPGLSSTLGYLRFNMLSAYTKPGLGTDSCPAQAALTELTERETVGRCSAVRAAEKGPVDG